MRDLWEGFRTGVFHAVGVNSKQTFFFFFFSPLDCDCKMLKDCIAFPKLLEVLGRLAF